MGAKHTPGPWVVQQLHHAMSELWLQIGYEKPDGTRWGPVCRINSPGEQMPDGVVAEIKHMATSNEQQLANAALIAAAPELLAACEAALEVFEENGLVLPLTEPQLRAAIAKAQPEKGE